ncbi:MAG: transglycosylase SLT domain-containing protein [Gemmatimonadota bacterium]
MTQRRDARKPTSNIRAFLMGTLLLSASLVAYTVGGDDAHVREAAPMAEVMAATPASTSAVNWDLPVTRNNRVDQWIDFLKGRNANKTRLWLERSGKYTPMIQAELRKRGMPEDLIYLAFIESGFSPNAKSHAAAVGLWQFIAETGKRYGLEVSSHVDERRDPIKATGAALDYLSELYDRFGSWYLAAAAYNTGENRVARIMREETGSERGDDDDFWKIASRLPAETRNYVPLMLAAGHIGKQPEQFGFDDVDYQAPLSFATVRVPQNVPLAAVAKAVGVDADAIEELNPELVRNQTPPTRAWHVRIPAGAERQFAANFPTALHAIRVAAIKEKSAQRYHSVRRGDNLSVIARRYDTSVSAIKRLNGLRSSLVRPGQKLRVS